jgi:hypothetical protein
MNHGVTAVGPRNVALGDINEDGKVDMLTGLSANGSGIAFRFGNGDGTFGAKISFSLGFDPEPEEVELVDVNEDGHLDILGVDGTSGLFRMLGAGTGSFAAPVKISTGGARGLVVADVNADGHADVVTGALFDGRVRVAYGDGQGGFAVGTTLIVPGGGFIPHVAVGDVDGDGRLDIVAPSLAGNTVTVFLGQAAGAFSIAATISTNGRPSAVGAGDFDEDGRTDLVVGSLGAFPGGTSQTQLFLNRCPLDAPPALVTHPVARQAGSPAALSLVATVSDDITPAGELTVAITSGAPGISVENLNNSAGNVFATVGASCAAPDGNSQIGLRVTDGAGLSTDATLDVVVSPDDPPSLGAYADVTLEYGAGTAHAPTIPPSDNGSVDAIGATSPSFDGTLSVDLATGVITVANARPIGSHTITVNARDNCGLHVTRTFIVKVVDTVAPQLTVPPDVTLEASGPDGAVYHFSASAVDLVDPSPVVTCTPASGSTFPLGTTQVACVGTDFSGNAAEGAFRVIVVDTTPPQITSVSADPAVIWPPNRRRVPVVVHVTTTDAVTTPACRIADVASNEPGAEQWQLTGPLSLTLLAERNGSGTGRVYAISVQCADESGNASVATTTVTVPHDQRRQR